MLSQFAALKGRKYTSWPPPEGAKIRQTLLSPKTKVVSEGPRRHKPTGSSRDKYATHSRESLDALRELPGHISIKTTAGYLHPAVDKAANPLDDLLNRSAAA